MCIRSAGGAVAGTNKRHHETAHLYCTIVPHTQAASCDVHVYCNPQTKLPGYASTSFVRHTLPTLLDNAVKAGWWESGQNGKLFEASLAGSSPLWQTYIDKHTAVHHTATGCRPNNATHYNMSVLYTCLCSQWEHCLTSKYTPILLLFTWLSYHCQAIYIGHILEARPTYCSVKVLIV